MVDILTSRVRKKMCGLNHEFIEKSQDCIEQFGIIRLSTMAAFLAYVIIHLKEKRIKQDIHNLCQNCMWSYWQSQSQMHIQTREKSKEISCNLIFFTVYVFVYSEKGYGMNWWGWILMDGDKKYLAFFW